MEEDPPLGTSRSVPSRHAARTTSGQWITACVAILLVAGTTFAVVRRLPVHHDIAWPLHVAETVLAGARPYVDIIEVHPPLILWFSLLAHRLADLVGISSIAGYHALTLSVGLVSLGMTGLMLRRLPVTDGAWPAVLLFVVTVVLFPLVGYSFGQEEHLMLALVLPYLFAVVARMHGSALPRPIALFVGAMAGAGFGMKPLYGVAWLALEGVYLHRRHWSWKNLLRTETVACAAVLAAYPVAVLAFTPEYVRVARWAAQVYYAFHPTPLILIVLSSGAALTAAAGLLHLLAPGRNEPQRAVLLPFMVACVGVVLLQGKGWTYHWYPALAAALLLTCVAAAGWMERFSLQRRSRTAAMALLVLVPLALGVRELRADAVRYATLADDPYHLPQMLGVVREHAPAGPLMVFSTTMQIGFPLVNYSSAAWSSRFSTLWLLPGLYADVLPSPPGQPFPYRRLEDASELERYLVDAVREDMQRQTPNLLIVDRYPPVRGMAGFDYLEYFGRDPEIRKLYEGFMLVAEVGHFLVYARSSATAADLR